MSLFSTLEEVKSFINVPSTLSVEALQSDLRKVGEDIIAPTISEEVWERLVDKYPSNLSAADKKLLPKVQAALIRFALYEHYQDSNVEWTGSGFSQRVENENYSGADFRDVNRFLARLQNEGLFRKEKLHLWLEKNRDAYPKYKASEERKENLQHFINTSIRFQKAYTNITAYTFSKLISTMENVETFVILPTLGQVYFDKLKKAVIDDPSTDDILPLLYIRKAVAHMTIKKAILANLVKFVDGNVVLVEDKSSYKTKRTPSNEQTNPTLVELEDTANRWLDLLIHTLKSKPTIYTDYHALLQAEQAEEQSTDVIEVKSNDASSGFVNM